MRDNVIDNVCIFIRQMATQGSLHGCFHEALFRHVNHCFKNP